MKITDIEHITLDLPFFEHCERHMHRASTHGERVAVIRIETDNGIVGWGEGRADVDRARDASPAALLWDDSAGTGLQMACLDAVGKAERVPAYRLLGNKIRDWCPISWWAIDMPPEDWAAQAQEAVRHGYTSFKLKARPWRDIVEQVRAISAVVPPHFRLDVDFNMFLLNAGNAIPVLREVEACPNVAIFESPIWQQDVEGNQAIRAAIRRPVSHHFGNPPIMTALREQVCDGFVIGGGPASVTRQAAIAAEANKPFWLQMVGTGLMTAFAMHLGAVLSHAQWPAITCHELWQDDLLTEALAVQGGYIRVPEAPGLGVTVDEAAVRRYRVEPDAPTPKSRFYEQRLFLRVRWPDGRWWAFKDEPGYQKAFYAGSLPIFERGVTLDVLHDDGSAAFAKLYDAVQREPVRGRD